MGSFVAVPYHQAAVSKPSSSSHPSFVALAHFLQGLKQVGGDEAELGLKVGYACRFL
jgi:hypothetical protein